MDSLRATMMVAGIFFHAALVYRPGYSWRFSDPSELAFFTWLTDFLHSFRMPAFFVVAGFFCALCFERDSGVRKLYARLMVFGVPFLVMMLTLQPLQYAMKLDLHGSLHGFDGAFWRDYFRDGEYISHLWFLLNLVFYYLAAWTVLALPGRHDYLRSAPVSFVFRYKTALTLVACACCLPLIVLLRNAPIGKAYGLHVVVEYAPFFIVGYVMYRHRHLFEEFRRVKLVDVCLLAGLVALYQRDLTGPLGRLVFALWFYQCGFVLAGLCVQLFSRLLNRENRLTRLISDSAYTIYLFHHILVVLFATWAARQLPQAGAAVKYCIVVGAVLALTVAAHQLLIARVALLKFLFNGRFVPRDILQRASSRPRAALRLTRREAP
jgi:glucan biosynthesis protein C